MPPDLKDLTERVYQCETLFDELRKVVGTLLEWKSKITGGMTVMVWVVGGVQSVVLVCLGLAANSLNKTAETLGNHAVELATAKTKIEAYMADGSRFTAEKNAASESALKTDIQNWVREELKHERP